MAEVVAMPQLGNAVQSCLVTTWHIQVGDDVSPSTIVADIETDKSPMEVPAGVSGTVLALLAKEGDQVPVKAPFFIVGSPGEDISNLPERGEPGSGPAEQDNGPAEGEGKGEPAPADSVKTDPPAEGEKASDGPAPVPAPASDHPPHQEPETPPESSPPAEVAPKSIPDAPAPVSATPAAKTADKAPQVPKDVSPDTDGKEKEALPGPAAISATAPPNWTDKGTAKAEPKAQPAGHGHQTQDPAGHLEHRHPKMAAAPEPVARRGVPSAAGGPASPRARRQAEEVGVDISTVVGTGPHGRILVSDVMAAAESASQPQRVSDEEVVDKPPQSVEADQPAGQDRVAPEPAAENPAPEEPHEAEAAAAESPVDGQAPEEATVEPGASEPIRVEPVPVEPVPVEPVPVEPDVVATDVVESVEEPVSAESGEDTAEVEPPGSGESEAGTTEAGTDESAVPEGDSAEPRVEESGVAESEVTESEVAQSTDAVSGVIESGETESKSDAAESADVSSGVVESDSRPADVAETADVPLEAAESDVRELDVLSESAESDVRESDVVLSESAESDAVTVSVSATDVRESDRADEDGLVTQDDTQNASDKDKSTEDESPQPQDRSGPVAWQPTVARDWVEAATDDQDGAGLDLTRRTRGVAAQSAIGAVVGTGIGGRVTRHDVWKAESEHVQALAAAGETAAVSGTGMPVEAHDKVDSTRVLPSSADGFPGPYTETVLTGSRRVQADARRASVASHAHMTFGASAPAASLLALRARFKASGESLGLSQVTIGDLVAYAAVRTVGRFPTINATVDSQTLRTYDAVHLGLAVDAPGGLVVPTIRFASHMGLKGFSLQTRALIAQARTDRIDPDLLAGATFTVTNLGAYGIESFTPILHSPQTAILGVNAIVARPVITPEGSLLAEQRISFSLTVDHAVVDGVEAARFLQALVAYVANIDVAILAEGGMSV
ncbi:MAG: 2-oxo acid dehydrogenase subunit E2 [Propionibacteriaceae bacterium]|nr:2-oxo acid dehydrogenase subunit E2 [Propionibacteriaceae bacterium]